MMRVNAVVFTTLAAGIIACGASSSEPKAPNSFARRAAFDLDCPVDELGYVAIKTSTPRTYGVVGCNKRATYVEICSIAMYGLMRSESCQWTMNGPIRVDAPAPAPPPPPPVAAATPAASAAPSASAASETAP